MSIQIIPVNRLTDIALNGLIEEFITRSGTDYGATESALDTKIEQVKNQLERGTAVVVFDDTTETTAILFADDPVIKRFDSV